jgi:glycosyltransferase involved in cell wall biosynthesis
MDLSKKRILHIITRSDWGGAPRIVKLLAKETEAEVAVACGSGGRLIEELRAEAIPVFVQSSLQSPINPIADFQALFQLTRLLQNESFDLIHCHSTKAGLLGRFAAAVTNTPTVFTVHGWGFYNTEYDWARSVITQGERVLARVTEEIVCVSWNDLKQGRHSGIIQKTNSTVIHNGVRPLSFSDNRSHLEDVCSIDPATPVIGTIARLVPQKNPLAVLRTAKQLQDIGRTVQTVVIGSGPLAENCKQYVVEHNLENVHLLGFREDALELLTDFAAFLLPSQFEGFPLTVLESLHAGVPVVAYDVGGVAEAIQHGETGFIVSADDHVSFVEHVKQLLADDMQRSEMGDRAQAVACEKFSVGRMVSDYNRVYNRVLSD